MSCTGNLANYVDQWKQITSDPWIIETIQGYRLEFVSQPRQDVFPIPPRFDDEQKTAISSEVSKLLSKGAIVEVEHCSKEFISNIFVVPKKTGDLRPVINLKPLNEWVCKARFKMETIEFARQLIHRDDFMASIDLKDAYFSIPIHYDDRKYLRFLWQNRLYEFVCLPFGYSLAPRTFTKILKPVYALLRAQGIRTTYYIDDTLIVASSAHQCSEHTRQVSSLLSDLGFQINYGKSHLDPSRTISFLGFQIDSTSYTLTLPEEKVDKIVRVCRRLLNTTEPTIREVAQVSGNLVSAFPAVKYLQLFYRSVEACKSSDISLGARYDDTVVLSPLARQDLSWVIDNIRVFNGRPIRDPPFTHTIESDASLLGWGASYNGQTSGGHWTPDECEFHINYLELLAAFFALKCYADNDANVCLKSDNTTAVGYLNKMGGMHSPLLNNLAREIWSWCMQRRISLTAQHIPGECNSSADFGSRHFNDRTEWSLHPTVFTWVSQRVFWPEIDLFASRLNAKLERYVSWHPDPGAWATNAFSFSWHNLVCYAFPPFSVISKALSKVQEDQAQLLLIAPVWKTQAWYPVLLSLLTDRPVLLPQWNNLLRLNHNGRLHPLRNQMRLAAWPISGQPSQAKAFQQGLPKLSPSLGLMEQASNTANHGACGSAGVINSRLISFKPL